MSLFSIFDVAGSGMSAQTVRLNTTASNMANAETVSRNEEGTYRARQPVFASMLNSETSNSVGVKILGVVESQMPARKEYSPDNPMADEQGYVYLPNINVVEEMANMISASRSYQNNVEVLNTSKQLLINTLRIGQ